MSFNDFGLENICKGYDSIIVDTSALFFDISLEMNRKEKYQYDQTINDFIRWTKQKIPKEILESAVDFNKKIALFLKTYPNIKIFPEVLKEYISSEQRYSERPGASLIREGLIVDHNNSINLIKEALKLRLVEDDPIITKWNKLTRNKYPNSKLSKTDRKIVYCSLLESNKKDVAVLTNDIKLMSVLSNKFEDRNSKKMCHAYHFLGGNQFKIFERKN